MNEELLLFLKEKTNWNVSLITSIERIGGLSSNNYKICYDDDYFFVRICTHIYLHTDRKSEIDVINLAAKYNLISKPYYFSIETGNMILPWIEGKMPSEDEFNSSSFIHILANRLKELHSLRCNNIFQPYNHIKSRVELCREFNIPLPCYIDLLLDKLEKLQHILSKDQIIGLCHNDLNASNMLISNNTLFLVDYEYSAMGDIFWDLATVSWLLDDKARHNLLTNYFGYYDESHNKRLLDYLYVVKLYNATWSLLKSKDSTIDYDYFNGASLIFEDLLQTLN